MRTRILSIMLGVLVAPAAVWANIAPVAIPDGGTVPGEPQGLEGVAVAREVLHIDARPLAEAKPVPIDVRYEIENTGPQRRLDVLFVGGPMADASAEVTLDGNAVDTRRVDLENVPESWRVPPRTPALPPADKAWKEPLSRFSPFEDTEDALGYRPQRRSAGLAFAVTLPPGPHTLKVRYKAEAMARHGSFNPIVTWQLAYVLAPAREWERFGGLHVTLNVPDDWEVATQPALARDGAVLRGTFGEVPADALAMTFRSPPQGLSAALAVGSVGPWLTLGLGAALTLVVAYLAGRWLGRKGWTTAWALILGLGLVPAWWVGIFVLTQFLWALEASLAAGPFQASTLYGPEAFFVVFGLAGWALICVPVAAQLSAFVGGLLARRRARAAATADEPRAQRITMESDASLSTAGT